MTGGTFGAAIMGSLMATRMATHLARAVTQAQESGALPPQMAAAMSDGALSSRGMDALNGFRSGGDVSGVPEAVMGPVRTALAASLHEVFLLAMAVAAVAVVVAVFMREIPLRKSNIEPE